MLLLRPWLDARGLLQLMKHGDKLVFPTVAPVHDGGFQRALFQEFAAGDYVLVVLERRLRRAKSLLSDLRDQAQPSQSRQRLAQRSNADVVAAAHFFKFQSFSRPELVRFEIVQKTLKNPAGDRGRCHKGQSDSQPRKCETDNEISLTSKMSKLS